MIETPVRVFNSGESASDPERPARRSAIVNAAPLAMAVSCAILLAMMGPLWALGDEAYFRIHDNLDSEYVYLHLLTTHGVALSFDRNTVIDQVMNGLPRGFLRNGLNFTVLLFTILTSHWAYIVNYSFVHLMAFAGMYCLLRTHIICDPSKRHLAILTALAFSVLAFATTVFGLSSAGLPWLAYAFLNLLDIRQTKRSTCVSFLIIVLFPFMSFIVATTPYVVATLAAALLVSGVGTRRRYGLFVCGLFVLLLTTIAVDYQLVRTMFDASLISHRTEFDWAPEQAVLTLRRFVRSVVDLLMFTGDGVAVWLVWVLVGVYAVKAWMTRSLQPAIVYLAIYIVLVVCAAVGYPLFVKLTAGVVPFVTAVHGTYVLFQLPFLYFLLAALVVRELQSVKYVSVLLALLWVGHVAFSLATNPEVVINAKLTANRFANASFAVNEPTYRQFVSRGVFDQIDRHIGKPKDSYRVVSIGILPSVAQLNGFYTLDSYQNNYLLSYKQDFREIIAPELAKNEYLRVYFDEWGSRCYVFVAELGRYFQFAPLPEAIKHVALNTRQLKAMGGQYILSGVRIENFRDNGLVFEGTFEESTSYWRIYLYRVA